MKLEILSDPSQTKTKLVNFEQLMLKIVQAPPNKRLSASNKTIVQDHLHSLSSQYKTPDHPPYQEMIEMAIRELNEKGGSRMETISKFLKERHNGLPWAHLLFLEQHLIKLCDSDFLIRTCNDSYMLSGGNPSIFASLNRKRRTRLRTRRSLKFGVKEPMMFKKPVVETGKHHQETVPSQALKFDAWAPRK